MAARLADIRARDARLMAQTAAAEDEERRALARDLHDEIGPLLFAADVDAVAIGDLAGRPAEAARDKAVAERAAAIREALAAIKRQVRDLLDQLRPSPATKIGLDQAIRQAVAFFAERRPGVDFSIAVAADGFGAEIDAALAAVTREAVGNALRHGRPRRIDIEIALRDGMIRLKVADDGGGLAEPRGQGYGIVGMRERVARLGGRLDVDNRLDRPGAVVAAASPPPPAASGRTSDEKEALR